MGDSAPPDSGQRPAGPDGGHRGSSAVQFVLIEPSHPGNVGAAARALQVMGFTRLVVVNPRHPDVNRQPEAIAFASGATRVLQSCRSFPTLAEAVAGSRLTVAVSAAGREFAPAPEPPRQIARSARLLIDELMAQTPTRPDMSRPAPVSLVFGTERTGLSIGQAQQCGRLCAIDAEAAYSSLNLAQAVQILAYEMRVAMLDPAPTARPAARHPDDLPATHEQIESMLAHLEQALVGIGYLDPAQPRRLMPRLRQLFARAVPSRKEIDILRGIARKMDRPG